MRNRVKELRQVRASELRANPNNWRKHPKEQATFLRAIMDEVGIAGAVIARETETGELELIDGHLRVSELNDEVVPVLVLDVTETEANKLLATYDPISAMAETDKDKLEQLLGEISTDSEALSQFLDTMAQQAGIVPPEFQPSDEQEPRLDKRAEQTCPNCGAIFGAQF